MHAPSELDAGGCLYRSGVHTSKHMFVPTGRMTYQIVTNNLWEP